MRRRILIAIVVVTILILIVAVPMLRRYKSLLGGMWIGDPGFLEKSGLSDMQLFIAPGGGDGYIIMTDTNGSFIANHPIEFECHFGVMQLIKAAKNAFRPTGDIMTGRVEISSDSPDSNAIPSNLKVSLSIADSSMTLFDNEKVFAYLYRDPVASHAAIVSWEVENE